MCDTMWMNGVYIVSNIIYNIMFTHLVQRVYYHARQIDEYIF